MTLHPECLWTLAIVGALLVLAGLRYLSIRCRQHACKDTNHPTTLWCRYK